MAKKISKTNAMRILEKNKIPFNIIEYPENGPVSAVDVANYLGEPTNRLFKTLVTTDNNKNYYVFCLPGDEELNLKIGAKIVNAKKIEMIKQKDLFPLTGYIHGGCSPVGMKKSFETVMDESALNFETIFVSGGKIGLQIEISPKDLKKILHIKFNKITK